MLGGRGKGARLRRRLGSAVYPKSLRVGSELLEAVSVIFQSRRRPPAGMQRALSGAPGAMAGFLGLKNPHVNYTPREAVTTLEDTARTARRVIGDAYSLTMGIGISLRDARAALRARDTPPSDTA